MSIQLVACDKQAETEFVLVENQDYVEDKLFALCEDLERCGVKDIEIASGLLFTLHYMLSKRDIREARKYYSCLLKQCHEQIEALHEFYELPDFQK
jgi:hypothetical protein